MTVETLGPFLTGPASAVFCLVFMLAGIYKLTVDKLLPMLGAALDRHLKILDDLVAQNRADPKAMIEAIQRIEVRISERDDLNSRTVING